MQVTYKPFPSFKEAHCVTVFASPNELMQFVAKTDGGKAQASEMETVSTFYSQETMRDVEKGAIEGNAEYAKSSASLMSKIEAAHIPTTKRKRVSSPYGRVSVGAYLAGDPMPARRKVKADDLKAPITVVVSLNSMGEVESADLEKRGVAIAALVRRLVKERPVKLLLSRFSECDSVNTCMLVEFPTTPIDVFRLSYLLSSQGFCRGAGFAYHRSAKDIYAMAGKVTYDVSASRSIMFAGGRAYSQSRHCNYSRDLSAFLNCEVLYIPGSSGDNPDFKLMTRDPVAWINDTVASLASPSSKAP